MVSRTVHKFPFLFIFLVTSTHSISINQRFMLGWYFVAYLGMQRTIICFVCFSDVYSGRI
jgi:hypothetical protein